MNNKMYISATHTNTHTIFSAFQNFNQIKMYRKRNVWWSILENTKEYWLTRIQRDKPKIDAWSTHNLIDEREKKSIVYVRKKIVNENENTTRKIVKED